MPTTAEALRQALASAFPGAQVEVRDTTGAGDHFAARVVTSSFEGRSLLERHRLVYDALGDAMRSDIHALGLTTETPGERQSRERKP